MELLEIPCFITCADGLEIDNADLVLGYEEHFDGSYEIKVKTVTFRVKDDVLARSITAAREQRAETAS